MVTFNQIKNLLDQGILPCIISQNGEIDYISTYIIEDEIFNTLNNTTLGIINGQLVPINNVEEEA